MDDLQEPPDVLDVRVAEREVVVAPVHPLAEPLRAPRQRLRRLDDDLAALAGELLEAVLLDLALRVQPELPLDADLDPEPLAVEAVLVPLVEAAQRLVALEDVLERPPPRRVDAERPCSPSPARRRTTSAGRRGSRSRSCSNVPSRSQSSRISSSSAGWSGLSGSGVNMSFRMRTASREETPRPGVERDERPRERNEWQPTQQPTRSTARS